MNGGPATAFKFDTLGPIWTLVLTPSAKCVLSAAFPAEGFRRRAVRTGGALNSCGFYDWNAFRIGARFQPRPFGVPRMSRHASFRQADVRRAWAAARKDGKEVVRTEIRPDGRIVLVHKADVAIAPADAALEAWKGKGAVRIRLKGINSVQQAVSPTAASATYPLRLEGRANASSGEPGFAGVHRQLSRGRVRQECRRRAAGLLKRCYRTYQASAEFPRARRERTRSQLCRADHAASKVAFGDLPLAALSDSRARWYSSGWRDQLADQLPGGGRPTTPGACSARVLSWGHGSRASIAANPCARGGRLYRGSRGGERLDRGRRGGLSTALLLQASTPRAHPCALDGTARGRPPAPPLGRDTTARRFRLRQGKTGARVVIPVGAPLKAALDAAPRRESTVILLTNREGNRRGRSDGFRASLAEGARQGRGSTGRNVSMTCAAPPSPASPWPERRKRRSRRSPGTRFATCGPSSLIRTICTATRSSGGRRSASSEERNKISQLNSQLLREGLI